MILFLVGFINTLICVKHWSSCRHAVWHCLTLFDGWRLQFREENETEVLEAVSSQPCVAALRGNPRRQNLDMTQRWIEWPGNWWRNKWHYTYTAWGDVNTYHEIWELGRRQKLFYFPHFFDFVLIFWISIRLDFGIETVKTKQIKNNFEFGFVFFFVFFFQACRFANAHKKIQLKSKKIQLKSNEIEKKTKTNPKKSKQNSNKIKKKPKQIQRKSKNICSFWIDFSSIIQNRIEIQLKS